LMEIIPSANLTSEDAGQLIMAARASWFDEGAASAQ
jgi:hypothetical protein